MPDRISPQQKIKRLRRAIAAINGRQNNSLALAVLSTKADDKERLKPSDMTVEQHYHYLHSSLTRQRQEAPTSSKNNDIEIAYRLLMNHHPADVRRAIEQHSLHLQTEIKRYSSAVLAMAKERLQSSNVISFTEGRASSWRRAGDRQQVLQHLGLMEASVQDEVFDD
ncbi:MAG: hypothetical protein AAF329_05795 [Cyanobacteria bacterium P01_A01_bin.17]